jgi:hypothetical protein
VAKKRPSTRRRAASATRRKTASRSKRRATSSKRAPKAPRERRIELKPIAALIGTTIERLRRVPETPATRRTIERLEMCSAEFAAICDPTDPFGCGPNMDFDPLAVS